MSSWFVGMWDKLQGELDWCDLDTTVWVVTLRGDFEQRGAVTTSLSVALDGAGKIIRLESGPLALQGQSD